MNNTPRRRDSPSEAARLQSAIFHVAARAKDLPVDDARKMLAAEVRQRNLTPLHGLWIDAAATSAALGKPYILSNEALWEATDECCGPDDGQTTQQGRSGE